MSKSVNFRMPPKRTASQWVAAGAPRDRVKMKRLTLDIPEPLHKAFKSKCVAEDLNMADVVREMIEKWSSKS